MHLCIITPVFNDWSSFSRLIPDIDEIATSSGIDISILAINDNSSEPVEVEYQLSKLRRIKNIEIITLAYNLGHVRAIAVGLVECNKNKKFDAVVVMDSDGEDRPVDIPRLVAKFQQHPDNIIGAQRRHRPGPLTFQIWYAFYKLIFYVSTGRRLDYGNFCLIPKGRLEALVRNSSIWINLAAALSRSRLPIIGVPIDRGRRYYGRSKMGLVPLVIHGLSAMAVYGDIIMVRLLLISLALATLTCVGIICVFSVKVFSTLAIPGWATSTVGILMVILVQAVMLSTIAAINIVSTRSDKLVVPLLDATNFVLTRRSIFPSKETQS